MASTQLALPRALPPQRTRRPKENIPQTLEERNEILLTVRRHVRESAPVPPLPVADLKVHADRILAENRIDPAYRDYVGVLVNNEMWREPLASVPYERRLLLLPKCLRVESRCPAPFDEFGLLCKSCGLCSIQDLQLEAERLGYAVLVAEGSAIVMSLIQTGRIDAIVGVSCLSVLERAFPYMEAAAIPGVAIPLLQDDCIDTTVDMDWIWDYIHLTSEDRSRRMDLSALREEVDFWFSPATLDMSLGTAEGACEALARDWLMRAGKRWRPFLASAVHQALQPDPSAQLPQGLRRTALAVECFHKASLIHDDIEDGDARRYGESTLHEEHGIPVALNAGDLLIGEGYRLLSGNGLPPEQQALMIQTAARGQRRLCQGQGAELAWAREPRPLAVEEVLEIFGRKTAPAFEVALQLGAIHAGIEEHRAVSGVLAAFSQALGIAYQIRDDLDDLGREGDLEAARPSLILAIAHGKARGEQRELLERFWKREGSLGWAGAEELCRSLGAVERAQELLEAYKEEAIRSLADLGSPSLKGLLRRVVGKIFNETTIKGWCSEFEEKRPPREEAALPPSLEERLAATAA